MMGRFLLAYPPPDPLLWIEFRVIRRVVMQMKPPAIRLQQCPHPRAFVPGGMVHPPIDDFALKTLHQLMQRRQERGGVSLHGFHHSVLAGQRVDPAEKIEPPTALAARDHHGPLSPLGPEPPQPGVPTIPALILKEHHPLVTKPPRLAEFFWTLRGNFSTPLRVAWRER